jgi:hypothetical protein
VNSVGDAFAFSVRLPVDVDPAHHAQQRRDRRRERGCWQQQHLEAIIARGIQVPVPPNASKRKTAWRGMACFRRRGRAAARAELRLITATHNLLKLHPHLTPAV